MTAARPRVSVVIPAWNAAHSLRACLDSVLAQSLAEWEAVVVDDGSDDDTLAVARVYTDPRIRVVHQDNQGQGAARNRGMAETSAEFVAFLDADDEWRQLFLSRTVAFLDAHPEAIAVNTAFSTRFVDGREVVGPQCVVGEKAILGERVLEHFFDFWAAHDHIRTGTALIRRSVIDQAGLKRADLRVSQDLEYWGYLATFGLWGFIPEPLWVGNSRAAAARGGWLKKYAQRRRLCPTVEAWQARILPRLATQQRASFAIVRGRVAAGYAHNLILGGRRADALEVVRSFGDAMPKTRVTRLLRAGAAGGTVAWLAVCGVVKVREQVKGLRMSMRAEPDAIAACV